MMWNIAGWMGVGLVSMMGHEHHDEDGTHCEVSFCYCEVEDNQKICTCHHPELHSQQSNSEDVEFHISEHTAGELDFCYYTKPHSDRDSDLALIVMDKLNTILAFSSEKYRVEKPFIFNPSPSSEVESGFPGNLLRPPMA